ncbi:hypothetical protein ACROYT_G039347 [Oculina patagonica]
MLLLSLYVMYSEWVSLRNTLQRDRNNRSVLHNFPPSVGRDVAHTVVKTLVQPGTQEHMSLRTEREVDWVMDVLCYGLTLQMTESDDEIVKGCVSIYLDWISILANPKKGIPEPLLKAPEKYAKEIFQHFRNLFVRREEGNLALQASLCIRVLQAIQATASEAKMSPLTWEALLKFLMIINDMLLSPPNMSGGLAEHLCEKMISVLLEVWLHASCHHFPAPSMWKTLHELCVSWRHHNSMIDYWSRTSLALTKRVIQYMYGPNFPLPTLPARKSDVRLPANLGNECLIQCWFRILHIIGNPVDLCKKEIISDTPNFKEFALSSEDVISPAAHPCLKTLPQNFSQAMKGVAVLVNAFLTITTTVEEPVKHIPIPAPTKTASPPTAKKRDQKSLSIGFALGLIDATGLIFRSQTVPSRPSSGTSSTGLPQLETFREELSSASSSSFLFPKSSLSDTQKPSGDSVLHLFGAWLFEAIFAKLDMAANFKALGKIYEGFVRNSAQPEITGVGKTGLEMGGCTMDSKFEPGRAEAYGALCRIFCSHRSGQELRPVYLSRFYLALAIGLLYSESCTGHVLCSILLNSADLLRVDLQGVQVLLPHLINALETVLPRNDVQIRCHVSTTELRRAAIHLLLSMLCLPLHFQDLAIKDMTAGWRKRHAGKQSSDEQEPSLTFISLKPRLIRLLLEALQCESDSFNVQILLGGVSLLIQDSEIAESLGVSSPKQTETPVMVSSQLQTSQDNRRRASTGSSTVSDGGSTSEVDSDSRIQYNHPFNKSYDLSTVQGLFVQLTHLLCNKLVVIRSSRWKSDVHITLAAFELLSGLAQLSMNHLDQAECKSTIHWLCDYVTCQANKKATHHSRDLHSMIVAAFSCLQSWLMSHPWLLDSQGCLHVVMEVVELGISGSKSREIPRDPQFGTEAVPRLKGDKDIKPVSFRVREAAEGLLTVIMEHLGAFPSPCGPAALSSLLDEEWVLSHVQSNDASPKARRKFQYFAIQDSSIIMGLLEESLKAKDSLPALSSVVRGPAGRYVWTMQLRQFSREKNDLIEAHLKDPGRPSPDKTQPRPPPNIKHRAFPEAVDSVPLTKADRSIPELDEILDAKLSEVQDHMRTLMQKQLEHETVAQAKLDEEEGRVKFPDKETEITPPRPCQEFSPSRLMLSHFGLLTIEGLKGNPLRPFEEASLLALNTTTEGLSKALKELDQINTCKHSKAFKEFLLSLGWPVDVASHTGWTGNIQETWNRGKNDDDNVTLRQCHSPLQPSHSVSTLTGSEERDVSGSGSDGLQDSFVTCRESPDSAASRSGKASPAVPAEKRIVDEIFYYADVSCEVAFIMPSLLPSYQQFRQMTSHAESCEEDLGYAQRRRTRSGSTGSLETTSSGSGSHLDIKSKLARQASEGTTVYEFQSRTMSLDSRPLSRQSTHNTSSETNVLVAWLERFEDHAQFPVDELLMEFDVSRSESGRSLLEKETVVIFIHHLRSGLYRIHIRATIRSPIGGPLVDGMVVSRRVLGTMLRQTALNICRRRRLEIDSYSPPQVCRKLKIQDIVKKFRHHHSVPDFYVSLFRNGVN